MRTDTTKDLQQILPYCCQIQRRLSLLVLHSGISSVGQQESAQLSPPLLRRLMEGSKCPFVCGVDARVVLDEQGSYVHVLRMREEEAVMKKRRIMKEEKSQGDKRGW